MTQPLHLDHVETLRLDVREPFHFRCTIWKPSHFPTGLEAHTQTVSWRTFRFGETICGVRLEMKSSQLEAAVSATPSWTSAVKDRLVRRLEAAYGLREDIGSFLTQAARVPALAEPVGVLAGMRMSCPESLFEIAVISLLLQNTTIHRSTQMMRNLLTRYGKQVVFDDVTLQCFFSPEEILNVSEDELRAECRLGYRAKYLPAFAGFFSAMDDDDLREQPREHVLEALQSIKGVGPYTAGVVASHALRDPAAVGLDVWNTKLAGRAFLGREDANSTEVRAALEKTVPGNAGLALLYLVEHQYLANPLVPLLP